MYLLKTGQKNLNSCFYVQGVRNFIPIASYVVNLYREKDHITIQPHKQCHSSKTCCLAKTDLHPFKPN